jgi:Tfp pilus assembly protein PilF
LAEKRISDAIELGQRIAKIFPDSSSAFVSKGSMELRAGDFKDGVSSFTRAVQLDRTSPEATLGLARAQAGAGMRQQAKATLESAIEQFAQKAPFELELGQLLLKEAETGDQHAEFRAEELFRSAITHDSKLAGAHYEIGELALRRGQWAKALVHLEIAEKLDPSNGNTHFALSRVYRRLGREQDAAKEAALFEKWKP